MIRAAICDDEKAVASIVEALVEEACSKRGLLVHTDIFYSGSSLNRYIEMGNDYDIIYLDIEMPYMNGIEFAKKLRQDNSDVILIYISAHAEYAIQLFDVDTFRFMKKPIDEHVFQDVFNEAYEKLISQNRFYSYCYNKNIYKLRLKNIFYFESRGRLIHIITKQGMEQFYGKLNDVEEKLKNEKIQFLRIHKSFLVNIEYAEKISYDRIYLRNGEELHISKQRQKIIQKQYLDMGEW